MGKMITAQQARKYYHLYKQLIIDAEFKAHLDNYVKVNAPKGVTCMICDGIPEISNACFNYLKNDMGYSLKYEDGNDGDEWIRRLVISW